jgi:hypothetical protein
MPVDIVKIVRPIVDEAIKEIRQNMAKTGTNATGKTSRSLVADIKQRTRDTVNVELSGRPFFTTIEDGRKATPGKNPSPGMVDNIKEWLRSKGKEQKFAYGIAKNINKFGTKLWQKGGRKDIYSNVLDNDFDDAIAVAILDALLGDFIKQAKK